MEETREQINERIRKGDYDCRYCWGKGHKLDDCPNRKKALEFGLSDQECKTCGTYFGQLGEKKRLEHLKICPKAIFGYKTPFADEPDYS